MSGTWPLCVVSAHAEVKRCHMDLNTLLFWQHRLLSLRKAGVQTHILRFCALCRLSVYIFVFFTFACFTARISWAKQREESEYSLCPSCQSVCHAHKVYLWRAMSLMQRHQIAFSLACSLLTAHISLTYSSTPVHTHKKNAVSSTTTRHEGYSFPTRYVSGMQSIQKVWKK